MKCERTISAVWSLEPSSITSTSRLRIIAGQDALDRGDDHFLFVEGGDQHRHRLAPSSGDAARSAPLRSRFHSASPPSTSSRAMPSTMAARKQ